MNVIAPIMTEAGGGRAWKQTIFAVNRTLNEDIQLETDLRSMKDYRILEHIVLEESDIKLTNSAGEQRVIPKTVNRSAVDGGMITSMLGRASWNVIRLGKYT